MGLARAAEDLPFRLAVPEGIGQGLGDQAP
jgi:hypothetical protein